MRRWWLAVAVSISFVAKPMEASAQRPGPKSNFWNLKRDGLPSRGPGDGAGGTPGGGGRAGGGRAGGGVRGLGEEPAELEIDPSHRYVYWRVNDDAGALVAGRHCYVRAQAPSAAGCGYARCFAESRFQVDLKLKFPAAGGKTQFTLCDTEFLDVTWSYADRQVKLMGALRTLEADGVVAFEEELRRVTFYTNGTDTVMLTRGANPTKAAACSVMPRGEREVLWFCPKRDRGDETPVHEAMWIRAFDLGGGRERVEQVGGIVAAAVARSVQGSSQSVIVLADQPSNPPRDGVEVYYRELSLEPSADELAEAVQTKLPPGEAVRRRFNPAQDLELFIAVGRAARFTEFSESSGAREEKFR